ncbi:MAG: hypothetical protein AB8B47_00280 [Roseobacter sp.]
MRNAAAALLVLWAGMSTAMDVGESEFVYSSELLARGFAVVPVSGVGNASFGLQQNKEFYLCFIADTGEAQATRQRVILDEIAGESPDRTVPNVPVVCILTQ